MEESRSSRYPTKKTEDVLHVLIRSRRFRDVVRKQYGDHAPAMIAELRKGYQGKEAALDDDLTEIIEGLFDWPVIDRYKQEGFYGEYYVEICGVKGAYYIDCGEGIQVGWFTTLADARGYLPNCLRA